MHEFTRLDPLDSISRYGRDYANCVNGRAYYIIENKVGAQ